LAQQAFCQPPPHSPSIVAVAAVQQMAIVLETPSKRRKVSTRLATNVLGNLGQQLIEKQREADIASIVQILRAEPDKITRCKAFLSSTLSDPVSMGSFKRGVDKLCVVPEQRCKPILCHAHGWSAAALANHPGLKEDLKAVFIWGSGQLSTFAPPEKEIAIDVFKEHCKQFGIEAGNCFLGLDLAKPMDWRFDYGELRLIKTEDGRVSRIKLFHQRGEAGIPLPHPISINPGELGFWKISNNYDCISATLTRTGGASFNLTGHFQAFGVAPTVLAPIQGSTALAAPVQGSSTAVVAPIQGSTALIAADISEADLAPEEHDEVPPPPQG